MIKIQIDICKCLCFDVNLNSFITFARLKENHWYLWLSKSFKTRELVQSFEMVDESHHSKMQKDGWTKYIPNFAFK